MTIKSILLVSFLIGLGAHSPSSVAAAESRDFDWCAPVVVRPLRRWVDREHCMQPWSAEEIASGADVVMMGGSELPSGNSESLSVGDPCDIPQTRASHAAYLQRLNAEADRRGRRVFSAMLTRFDLVGPHLGARPGFSPAFLASAKGTWENLLAFFSADGSPACVEGCRFSSGERFADRENPDRIEALMARVDALEGRVGAARSYVYYLSRSRPGMRVFHATRVLADLSNPEYRVWRAADARQALDLGGYDAVFLNHKLHQYSRQGSASGHWLGSPKARDVAALNELEDTLWSTEPVSYGYTDYVRGWHAFAAELRTAGVPYGVHLPLGPWRSNGSYDDPATPEDEAGWIRAVARRAALVLLSERPARVGEFDRVRSELEREGVRVVPVDGGCGLARIGN